MATTSLLLFGGTVFSATQATADIYYTTVDYTADGSAIALGYLGVDLEGADGISPTVVYAYGLPATAYELILFHYDSPGFTTFTTLKTGTGSSGIYILWSSDASTGGGPLYNGIRVGAGVTVDSTILTTYASSYWKPMYSFLSSYIYFYYPGIGFGPYGEFTTAPASAYGDPEIYDNFLAFKFTHGTKGGTYYGWIQIYLLDTPSGPEPTIHIVAWGLPTDTVITGVIPEPSAGALGALALGAMGVAAWRRKRREDWDEAIAKRKEGVLEAS